MGKNVGRGIFEVEITSVKRTFSINSYITLYYLIKIDILVVKFQI